MIAASVEAASAKKRRPRSSIRSAPQPLSARRSPKRAQCSAVAITIAGSPRSKPTARYLATESASSSTSRYT
jgi:hypothetical protein